jgi:hypothetical protein
MWTLLLVACSEYDLNGAVKDPDAPPDRDRGSPDVDTEDALDTGGTASGTVTDDPGDTGCTSGSHHVRIGLAADDVWTAWLDDAALGTAESWWQTTWIDADVGCGPHVLAVFATDLHQAISGFIAAVYVDDELRTVTNDGAWRVTAGHGADGWRTAHFDDSGWSTGVPCEASSATSWWGGSPDDLRALGAWWIWSGECLDLGNGSFRWTFDVE